MASVNDFSTIAFIFGATTCMCRDSAIFFAQTSAIYEIWTGDTINAPPVICDDCNGTISDFDACGATGTTGAGPDGFFNLSKI